MTHRLRSLILVGLALVSAPLTSAWARDALYEDSEVEVFVTPGEPTQLQFPSEIAGGFRKKLTSLSLEKKDSDLIIFSNEGISDAGEALIIRLKDGRSYSVRVKRASADVERDAVVRIQDQRIANITASEEEEPPYKDKSYEYAPATAVSGLMRELTLVSEFGKKAIPGYRMTDRFKGETVLNDGTMNATIDSIFVGPNLWGYVIDAQNMLDQTQKINPATFRLDGTRAISAQDWELAPKPLNIEQQISGKDRTKIYIVTRAKN